ncbi:hypothetical protein AAZX31_15G243400 [Glycine max]|uniref:Peptidase A1 domain-containing protein n=1 Tax=Glycine max TaxID=3847 RepID=I1MJB7_SOYBN|nr:aspartic proteinase CDR1 [Glycine max]KAG5117794.1 hypothetical protein JHK84_043907 [Glycine max]KAH1148887.1 hypothetical protein GYH30_043502 [Glycine max]KAH1210965.1 putative aspartic protease [Glycine max]KRH13736.1 hypothetical protein GLYMA_15G260700v4 [Glycine max]|eukprot:XP_003546813.1 aspartic proteinase CDR1 [Glycine max]
MHPWVFMILALFSLSTLSSREAREGLRGFSVDLIHRDSPSSPFYNPSLTPSERIINAALRSMSRLQRVSHFLDENKLPESLLIPDKGEYLMRFYIGSPPVERLAMVDTGSSLIWLQCSPCHNCFPQETPLFEPLKSSTYKYATCDSQPCTLLQPSQRDCGKLGQCIYGIMYGDKSFSVGILGTETLSFGSTGGAQTVSFPNTIFGCGVDNNFTIYTSNKVMGIAGLGAGPLSLVSQLGAQIGHKFSYCLLPYDSTSTSKLKFGSEAIITTNGVVSTPLIIKPSLPTYYFLNLEAVTIGQKVVSTGQTDGNIVIDSGTPLTYLENTFYNNFVASLQETLGVKLLQDLPSPLKTCFPNRANLAIPDIAFQFTGASVALRPKNVLIPLTDSNILCLAVVPSSGIGISLFGSIAQYDFQVEYDLEGKKVSFAPTDCAKV